MPRPYEEPSHVRPNISRTNNSYLHLPLTFLDLFTILELTHASIRDYLCTQQERRVITGKEEHRLRDLFRPS